MLWAHPGSIPPAGGRGWKGGGGVKHFWSVTQAPPPTRDTHRQGPRIKYAAVGQYPLRPQRLCLFSSFTVAGQPMASSSRSTSPRRSNGSDSTSQNSGSSRWNLSRKCCDTARACSSLQTQRKRNADSCPCRRDLESHTAGPRCPSEAQDCPRADPHGPSAVRHCPCADPHSPWAVPRCPCAVPHCASAAPHCPGAVSLRRFERGQLDGQRFLQHTQSNSQMPTHLECRPPGTQPMAALYTRTNVLSDSCSNNCRTNNRYTTSPCTTGPLATVA